MLYGFFITLYSLFYNKQYFNKFVFRTVHLLGIIFVALLNIINTYCPLTKLENYLSIKSGPGLYYKESFIYYYLEKYIYFDINPLLISIPTIFIAIFTLLIYIIKPPKMKKNK